MDGCVDRTVAAPGQGTPALLRLTFSATCNLWVAPGIQG